MLTVLSSSRRHKLNDPMNEARPSATAQAAAMRRAAHQILDYPKILEDPLSLRIIGIQSERVLRSDRWRQLQKPAARYLRAYVAVRSRFAEDELAQSIQRGVRQYVILGAGLDTFAYRNPYPESLLRVFEVDHPATQAWKCNRLREARIPIPKSVTFVQADFEKQTLADALGRSGFKTNELTFFSWLGVTPYLRRDAVMAALTFVASAVLAGSELVFDFALSQSSLDQTQRLASEAVVRRAATGGEPWMTSFDPGSLANDLLHMGFQSVQDFGPKEMNARYFKNRTDNLRVRSLTHLMKARI
jgi:methyltransferase (TIGR00027 family)